MIKISKSEAKLYCQRWEAVHLFEVKELRKTTMKEKFHQLCMLISWMDRIQPQKNSPKEIAEVRSRWNKLYKKYRMK